MIIRIRKMKVKLQKVGFNNKSFMYSTVFPEENGIRGSWAGRGAALRAEGRHVQQTAVAAGSWTGAGPSRPSRVAPLGSVG